MKRSAFISSAPWRAGLLAMHEPPQGERDVPRIPRPQNEVLELQRTAGNAAVSALLQRREVVTTGGGLSGELEIDGGDPNVKSWQRALNSSEPWIPEKLVIDGIAGPKTDTATRLNEWRQGGPITGRVPRVIETEGGGL